MGNYVEVKYGLLLKELPDYFIFTPETEELRIAEHHPFSEGVITEYGHCLTLHLRNCEADDISYGECETPPEGTKYILMVKQTAKRAFEWFDGVIGIKNVLAPYMIDNHPNELGEMEDEDGVEIYNGIIVLDKAAFIEKHKERMKICEDCKKFNELLLCENMRYCKRAFDMGGKV